MKKESKKGQYYSILFILIIFVPTILSSTCQQGCQTCIQNQSSTSICQQCQDDFLLNTQQNLCVYQKCQKNTYFEYLTQDMSSSKNGKCVALCNQLNTPNIAQNTCNEGNFCSIQYVQPASTTKSRLIQSVFADGASDKIFLVYDIFLNSINKETGSFERSYSFDSTIFSIQQYNNLLFLFGNQKNSVFLWSSKDNTTKKLVELEKGSLKVSSQIIEVDNNGSRFLVSSFDDIQQITYLTQFDINKDLGTVSPSFSISLQSNQKVFLFFKILVIQSSNMQVLVQKIVENPSDLTLSLVSLTSDYMCGYYQLGQVKYAASISNTLLFQFTSTKGVFSISKNSNNELSCSQILIDDIPLKVSYVNLGLGGQFDDITIILVALNDGVLKAFNFSTLKEMFSLKADSIKDFQAIIVTQDSVKKMKIYILNMKNIVEVFTVTFNMSMNGLSSALSSNPSFNSLILTPSQFMRANSFLDSSGQVQYLDTLYLVSQTAHIIRISDGKTLGIAQDFTDKIFQNEQKVNKLVYSEKADFIVSCGDDGKVIIWQALDLMQPIYWYQYSKSGQKCLNAVLFKDNILAIQFDAQIVLMDIYNQLDIYTYAIAKTDNTFIQVLGDYLFCLTGTSLNIFKSKESLYATFTIIPSSVSVSFIKFFINSNLQLIFQDSSNKLSLYEFVDGATPKFQLSSSVQPYQAANPIYNSFIFLSLFDSGDLIMINDTKKNLIILDMTFTEKINIVCNQGQVQRVKTIDNEYFFFIVKVFDVTAVYQYASIILDTNTLEFQYIGTNYIVLDITALYKIVEIDQSITFNYYLVNPIGYSSYFFGVLYNNRSKKIFYDKFYYTPGNNQVTSIGNAQKNLAVVGSQTGEVRVIVYNKGKTPEKVYTSNGINQDIQNVYNSFKIGKFFILTSYQIICFSQYTNKITETVSFVNLPTPPSAPAIQNFIISDELQIFVAYIATEIIVRDFKSNNLYSSQISSNSSLLLTVLNGVYIDEQEGMIYAYGSDIIKSDITLTKIKRITLKSFNTYPQCIFIPTTVFCQLNQNQLVIFDRTQSFSIIQTITVQTALQGFKFMLDLSSNQLILFKTLIELYNLSGVYIMTVQSITTQITQLEEAGNFIMAITPISGYIFQKQTFAQKGIFQPAGGSIQKAIFIKAVNQIAFFTDEIRYGQMLFYNLDNQQSAGSIINTLADNKIGRVVQGSFDNDSLMLNYIDQFGNFNNVIFSSSKTTDNTISILDMQNLVVSYPKGYVLDFDQNSIYVFSNDALYKHNYNLLTRPMQRLIKNQMSLQISVNISTDPSSQTADLIFFVDYWNNLYKYSDYHTTFQTRYDEEILEMQTYKQDSNTMVVIFFQNSILVFKETLDFTAPNSFLKKTNINFRKTLLVSNGRIIFNTVQNEIVEWDFLNNINLFSLKLDNPNIIINTLELGGPDSQNWFFMVGLKQGSIVSYNMKTSKSNTFSSFGNSPVIKIVSIKQDNSAIAIVKNSGEVFEVDSITFNLKQDQKIAQNRIAQSVDGGNWSNEVGLLNIDFANNRYFLTLLNEKHLGVYSLIDHSFIKYLSFADDELKQLILNESYLVLTTASQINVFDAKSLQYINRLRRYNRKDRISDIRFIDNNKLVIVFTSRIETVQIDSISKLIYSVDVVSLTDSRIVSLKLLTLQKAILIVGISKTSIFEKRVSLGLFDTNGLTSATNSNTSCVSQLQYSDISQISNQFDYLLSTSVTNIQFMLSVLISNQIRPMSFLNKSTVKTILRPINTANNILNLQSDSFQLLPFNVQLENFNIKFVEEDSQINIHTLSSNITLKDIVINNQSITSKTRIIIDSKNIILIQNLKIQNINFILNKASQTRRNLESQSNTTPTNSNSDSSDSYSLFQIKNCTTILIQDLYLDNVVFNDASQFLLSILNSQSVTIQNLEITNSVISGNLFQFSQIASANLQHIKIQGCKKHSKEPPSGTLKSFYYLFSFIGILNLSITDYQALSNTDLSFLSTSRKYNQDNGILTLNTDILFMKDVVLQNNIFDNQTNRDLQYILMNIESSSITITSMNSAKNFGNCFINTSASVQIINSIFESNIGLIGAALHIQDLSASLFIKNSQFNKNSAFATGGAIMLTNVNMLEIDSLSTITENSAEIGGGIRIISNQQKTKANQDLTEVIKATFSKNKASIFGNNIGRFPTTIKISLLNDDILFQKELQVQTNSTPDMINLKNIQSGGLVPLQIQLFDADQNKFNIDQTTLKNDQYPIVIQQELSQYQIEVAEQIGSADEQTADIKGEALVTTKQFDSSINSFIFKTLSISFQPSLESHSIVIKFSMYNQYPTMIIPVTIAFRKCRIGEIPQSSTSNIITCNECPQGSYSLVDPNEKPQEGSNSSQYDLTCKKCPQSASNCEKDQIILEKGYWRLNKMSDLIIRCNDNKPDICDESAQSSRNGCIQGYMGPLCESCDVQGSIWDNERYTQSFSVFQCNKCSDQVYQMLFISLSVICLALYIIFSVVMFMNSYTYNSTCCYLRYLHLLPLSKSSIKDESTFFIKALVNYLQLSSVLFQFSISFLPQIFAIVPSIAGQPVSKIIVSSSCLYRQKDLERLGVERLRTIVQAAFPFFYFVIFLVIFTLFSKIKLFGVGRYHKYIMLNFLFLFFQPDSISFFTSALSCRQIGDSRYNTINLQLSCNDPSFTKFKYYAIFPNLLFWALFPLVIFYVIIKYHSRKNNLHYCTTKYKYGYYYLEFKNKYWYWEFVRIYFKLLVVITITLLRQYELITYMFIIVMIFLYIFFVQRTEPFESHMLLKLEIQSYFVLIFNILLSQLNQEFPSVVFDISLAFLHYSFIIIIFLIIIKFKINNNSKGFSEILRNIAKKLLPAKYYNRITKHRTKGMRALVLWRKVFKNLLTIREKKAQEQIKQIDSIAKSRTQKLQQSKMARSFDPCSSKIQSINSVHIHSNGDNTLGNEKQESIDYQNQETQKEKQLAKLQTSNNYQTTTDFNGENSNRMYSDRNYSIFKMSKRYSDSLCDNIIGINPDNIEKNMQKFQDVTFTKPTNRQIDDSEESIHFDIEFEEDKDQYEVYQTKPIQCIGLPSAIKKTISILN